MATTEKFDERVRALVTEALTEALAGATPEAVAGLADAVVMKLQPSFGAAAQRRRLVGELRAAYKDGFLSGRIAGRFARWHGEIWSRSQTALRLRRPTASDEASHSRYARYNFD